MRARRLSSRGGDGRGQCLGKTVLTPRAPEMCGRWTLDATGPRPIPIRAVAAEPVDWGIDKGPDPGQIADNRGAVGHGAEANGDAFESHRRTRATGGRRDTLDGDDASEEGSVLKSSILNKTEKVV